MEFAEKFVDRFDEGFSTPLKSGEETKDLELCHLIAMEAICYATPPSGWLEDDDVNRNDAICALISSTISLTNMLPRCLPYFYPFLCKS